MTFEEFQQQVMVVGVPIEGTEVEHPKGGLTEGTRFWLHTSGMPKFGRPELEIYDVPAAYVTDAFRRLNKWAFYSLTEAPLLAGENIREGDSPLHPFFEVVASPHPFWAEFEETCLRIQLGAVPFECAGCGHKPKPGLLH